jgi:hypothetical protein
VEECHANPDCREVDTQLVAWYCLSVPKFARAWIDPVLQEPKTLHHPGRGSFMVAGGIIDQRPLME